MLAQSHSHTPYILLACTIFDVGTVNFVGMYFVGMYIFDVSIVKHTLYFVSMYYI